MQGNEILISRKPTRKGDDGHKVVSVRMKEETVDKLDALSAETNRSRNELINLLLEASLQQVTVTEGKKG
ncbi:MAG: CopG family transcriptional regulator [Clostridia bacterium]|nr:CopG family transcriptional regulator [Clostridia bacterium]MBQ8973431.1 CopG family transcriptional regulator [Clostridia bacterium]